MIAPLTHLDTQLAVLTEANVDTDTIFPARFLLITERVGLGQHLFRDRRYDGQGAEIVAFPLNRPQWRDAQALVVGDGFGTGSSREQAVWALVDHGIRVILGTDFGDIFANNAAKNGLVLILLQPDQRDELAKLGTQGARLTLDVAAEHLEVSGFGPLPLQLQAGQRDALLNGWEDIDRILGEETGYISAFEDAQRMSRPWLWEAG